MPDHPDQEQLAAFQAGDGDRRQLADLQAHLDGCPSCAEAVASVERARRHLALLEEPDLPPGLHDGLAAALEAEAARTPVEHPVSWFARAGTRAGAGPSPARAGSPGSPAAVPRPAPWYRRRVAWGAAAALLLAALVAVPLLDRSSELSTAGGAGGGGGLASPEAAGTVPVILVPGEISAAAVRARLAGDTRAKAALDAATGTGTPGAQAATPGGPGATPGAAGATRSPGQDGGAGTTGQAAGAGPATLAPCLTAATAEAAPATRPLTPAFLLEGSYRGRQATVLVTASTGQPGRVDLWVFPRGSCSGPPLASERVR